ncbi:Phosphoenolpyruvate phosphomutase [invertebrate metagenome]|uniref:phosphoenolpyruvate mutase n=1 Tax=invertebrate metagenome TaxID=1711999 RepID=A0A484HB43_9ZZZZ
MTSRIMSEVSVWKRSKAAHFRAQLTAPTLTFLMEAHNGLSARVVEDAGFEGIWASGLSISAALGVRDRNEASWTQVLDVLEFMSDATSIPILVDGDTGYGDFNNFRRLVKKLCQRQIAAVCIEDKLFPKTNSFLDGSQSLAEVDEFCGKIKAGKDSQTHPDFSIIARVEALIAGHGLEEALRRAEAYHTAGADGILIHSKKSTAEEILHFSAAWDSRAPLLIAPTMYYLTPTDCYRRTGISMCIWANHNLRAALAAMRDVSGRIFREQGLVGVEEHIASVSDVFDIAGEAELTEAEKRYLPGQRRTVQAVVLAASRGSQLSTLTADLPKCMLDVRGEPLLKRLVRSLTGAGVRGVTVVAGYCPEAIALPDVDKLVNYDYATTGEITSLARAEHKLYGECIISYGDILFRDYILSELLQTPGHVVLVVDSAPKTGEIKRPSDLVHCTLPHSRNYLDDHLVELRCMSTALTRDQVCGEWIGLARLSAQGAAMVRAELAAMRTDGTLATASLPDLFNRLVARGDPPRVAYITGHWLDVNDAFGLARARNFL